MEATSPQFNQLKSAMKTAWMAGDFSEIAKHSAREGAEFVSRLSIQPGARVLDVACGTGNTAIPAAHAGAEVIGVDIATNSLEQARARAEAERVQAKFQEGDAEELPFRDGEFDVVITMFGAMFAPRPERVAAELLRVCKPGGTIAMANWTPDGFVGKSFRTSSKHVPPPPDVPSPLLWGDENVVRQRFANGSVQKLYAKRQSARFEYPYTPKQVVDLFREYFGPTKIAFSRLDNEAQARLAADLEALYHQHNEDSNGTTKITAEYLEVLAVRA